MNTPSSCPTLHPSTRQRTPWLLLALLLAVLFWLAGAALPASAATRPREGAQRQQRTAVGKSAQLNFTPVITATKNDAFPGAEAEPGETISYTVVVGNSGSSSATDVTLSDVIDLHTTFVSGSLRVTPLAIGDTYAAIGNTHMAITATNGLLANDVDPDDPAPNPAFNEGLTIVLSDTTSANGGAVSVSADGAFTYDPPAGFEGSDTFSYTVEDGHGLRDAGTVTVTVSDVIWYVDNTADPGGDGRSHAPFDSVAAFNSTAADEPGDVIFLYEQGGSAYDNGLTLLDDQQLIGQGVDLATAAGLTPPLGSTFPGVTSNPTLNNTTADNGGNGMVLAQDNAIHGLDVGITGGAGISGSNFGTLTANTVSVTGSGAILSLATGTLDATFDALSTTSSATTGVSLTGVDGSLTAGSGSIAGATGTAFDVNGGTATVTYPGSIDKSSSGRIVQVQNRLAGAGTIALSGNLSCDSNCTGINVANNSGGTVTFSGGSKTLNTGTNTAVLLSSNGGATINFTGGGLDIDTTTATGFIAGGGGTVTVTGSGNTINTTTGTGVNIANTTIGSSSVTFESVSVNGATNGIVLNATGALGGFSVTGDAGSTVNGSGGTLTNITGDAIQLTDTMSFAMDQLNMSSISDHGIAGVRVDGLSVRNATFTNMGDADGEDVFSFDRDTLGDNGLVGAAVFQNLTVTTFAERTIDIVNEGSGTLDLDILDVSADDNDDTFGEDAIRVQTEGSVNADVLVSGGVYNDLELDVLAYFSQGTGTNMVEVTGVTSTNGGGPDNNPNGGGVAVIGSAGSSTNFDINANSLTGVQGAVVQIIGLAGAAQTVTLNGTIGGAALAEANTLTSDNADGIDLDFDGDPGGGSTIGGTILVQNNTINFEDDGIGVDHRDAAGTMNITIRDNTLNGIAGDDGSTTDIDDGIFVFTDDDVDAAVNQLNLEMIDNEINDVAATKNVIEIVDVQNGNKVCFAATGTSISSGDGNIELDTDAAADLVVDADSAANLSALNNGITVVEAATPTYNSAVDCIDLTSSVTTLKPTTPQTWVSDAPTTIGFQPSGGVMLASYTTPNTHTLTEPEESAVTQAPTDNASVDNVAFRAGPHRAKRALAPPIMPAAATPGDTVALLDDPFPLPAGETVTATFAVSITAPLPAGVTSVQNQATVSGSNFGDVLSLDPDPNPGLPPANGETLTPVNAAPDLSLAKDDGGVTVTAAGETVTYTLTFSNTGTQHASGVVLTETVPAHTTFNAGAGTAGWSCAPDDNAGSTCTLPVGSVNAGDPAATALFAVEVDPSVPAGTTQISNTAQIGDDGTGGSDPTPANNTAAEATPLLTADLVVAKQDQPDPVAAGETLTYTVTITNKGPAEAHDVVATDILTDALTLTGSSGCAEDPGGAPTCSLGAIAAGSTATYTLSALLDSATLAQTITNTVSVTSTTVEGAPGEESATITSTVNVVADLQLTKSDTPDPVVAGNPLTYTLTLTNHGPSQGWGVKVDDTLPLAYNHTGNSCGVFYAPPNPFEWVINDMPPGAVLTCVITGTVDPGVGGTITNTAFAGTIAFVTDPDPGNDSVDEPTTVAEDVFSIDDVSRAEGDTGTSPFTFTISRANNAAAASVEVATNPGTATPGVDYTPLPTTTVSFAAGGSLTQTVTVDVAGDTLVEADETFFVNLSNPSLGVVGDGQGAGTILNDDGTTVDFGQGAYSVAEDGGPAVVTVSLSAPSIYTATVHVATSEGTASAGADYTPVDESLSIPAGRTAVTVTVPIVDDGLNEDQETLTLTLSDAANATLGSANNPATLTIVDDEEEATTAFLPLALHGHVTLPDLVVRDLRLEDDGLTVVIANEGRRPVVDAFWLDVYVDPDPPPTAVNQTWPLLSDEGLVWGVEGAALPLQVGRALTLTVGDAYYVPAASDFSGNLAPGTPLYAQVDSANAGVDYGAVLETHEAAGDPYNNVFGPLAPPAGGDLSSTDESLAGDVPRALPPRLE